MNQNEPMDKAAKEAGRSKKGKRKGDASAFAAGQDGEGIKRPFVPCRLF